MWQTLTPQEKDAAKAGAILLVVLYGGLFYLNTSYVADKIKGMETERTTIAASTEELNKRIKEMDEMRANMVWVKQQQAILAEVAKKLPSTIDPQGFQQALKPMLETTKIEYTEMAPQPPINRTSFTEIPYKIVCGARYHDYGQFLNLAEENPNRFMRVRTFTIENSADRPTVHPITVDLATFMFNTRG